MIRTATTSAEDGQLFAELWFEYLMDQEKKGSIIRACPENVQKFMELYYGPFVCGTRDGIVLFAGSLFAGNTDEVDAVLVWGDAGQIPFKNKLGKLASCLGTYVRPGARQSGLSFAIRSVAKRELDKMGFTHGMGAGLAKNEEGIMSGFGSIGFDPYEVTGIIPFRTISSPHQG